MFTWFKRNPPTKGRITVDILNADTAEEPLKALQVAITETEDAIAEMAWRSESEDYTQKIEADGYLKIKKALIDFYEATK